MDNFNANHPELNPGEGFVKNARPGEILRMKREFPKAEIRRGRNPYGADGTSLYCCRIFPVFCKKSYAREIEKKF